VNCPQYIGFGVGVTFAIFLDITSEDWCDYIRFVGLELLCGGATSFLSLLSAHVIDYIYFLSLGVNYQINGRPRPPQPQPPQSTPTDQPLPEPTPPKLRIIPTVGGVRVGMLAHVRYLDVSTRHSPLATFWFWAMPIGLV
jgi:hypothetical protein